MNICVAELYPSGPWVWTLLNGRVQILRDLATSRESALDQAEAAIRFLGGSPDASPAPRPRSRIPRL